MSDKSEIALAMRGFYHKSDPNSGSTAVIRFKGVGLKMIFGRPRGTSYVSITIDGVLVDGTSELSSTGDVGHTDWTDLVDGGFVDLDFSDYLIADKDVWFTSDGINPKLGKNPCVFCICDHLLYTDHIATVQATGAAGVYIEGFATILRSVEYPQHEFLASRDIISIEASDSLADCVNDVVVVGDINGNIDSSIQSRSTDIYGINDPSSPNYIGQRRSWFFADSRVINQDRAAYLSAYVLQEYSRGVKRPHIESVGLPWVEPNDPVAIQDGNMGFLLPEQQSPASRLASGGRAPVPFSRYWIENISERFSRDEDGKPSYDVGVNAISREPIKAYEAIPEPPQSAFECPISGFKLYTDDGQQEYNPFSSDVLGNYVNVEFSMLFHARSISVRVIAGSHIYEVGNTIGAGTTIAVLMQRTGFTPAGEYVLRWDGWMAGSDGKGRYAPIQTHPDHLAEDANYYILIECERAENGESFIFRSDVPQPDTTDAGSLGYIQIVHDRSVYSGSFALSVSPAYAGASTPLPIYDRETNGGRGVSLTVTIPRPCQIQYSMLCRRLEVPSSRIPSTAALAALHAEPWDIVVRGPDSPVLEPGTYTFYFSPPRDGAYNKDGTRICYNWNQPTARVGTWTGSWYVAWQFKPTIIAKDLSGYTENLTDLLAGVPCYLWGGPTSSSYQTYTDRYDANNYFRFYKIWES